MDLIKAKVGEFSISEAFLVGLSKTITERISARFIGNGTFMSGTIKLVSAWGIPKVAGNNQMTKIVATGLAVDGVEDIVTQLVDMFWNGQKTNSAEALIM